MRAAVYQGPGRGLTVESLPDPAPGPREVVIRIERCGICGSDLHMTDGIGLVEVPPGTVLGHEYAGEVVEVGADVEHPAVGERVTALATPGCGRCEACQRGELLWCVGDDKIMALTGAYAEYVSVGAAATMILPSGVTSDLGALAEPLSVAHHAVELSSVDRGQRVAVLGAGAIALAVVYWLRRRGLENITVLARTASRESIARKMGAESFITVDDSDALSEIDRAEVVFEAAGHPGALSSALPLVRPRGTVIGLGFCDVPDSIVPALWVMPEIRLQFAMMYGKSDFAASLQALAQDPDRLTTLITATVSLDELPAMFSQLRGSTRHCKVLVDPAAL